MMTKSSSLRSMPLYGLVLCPILCIALGVDPQELAPSPSYQEVASRFTDYVDSGQRCAPMNNGARVIISGFGLWSNRTFNLSGFVIDNLVSNQFWPADSSVPSAPPPNYSYRSGALENGEGVRIINRSFRLRNGHEISACLILVSVMWDFAGAVIANEMTRFQPEAVIMTGVSPKAYLEAGAFKFAEFKSGFNSDGTPDPTNIPFDRLILRTPKAPLALPMTWDNQKLAPLIIPLLKKLRIHLNVAAQARVENEYICNNMSYLALAAGKNLPLHLAGNEITLKSDVRSQPKIGFFHFPNLSSIDRRHAQDYARVILTLVEGVLPKLAPTLPYLKTAVKSTVRTRGEPNS